MVVGGFVEPLVAVLDRDLQERLGLGADAAAVDVHPAPVADEAAAHLVRREVGEGEADAVGRDELDPPGQRRVGHALGRERGGALDSHLACREAGRAPLGDVEVVDAPGGHEAERVVVDVAPECLASALDAVVGRRGRRAEPHIVVEAVGHRQGRGGGDGGAARHADLDRADVAEVAVDRQLTGEAELRLAALLEAGLEHGAVALDGVAHGAALGGGEGQGLFAVDILPRLRRRHVVGAVPLPDGGADHGVDVLAGEQLAEVVVVGAALVGSAARLGVVGLDPPLLLLALEATGVADGEDLCLLHGQECLHVHAAAPADTDHADGDASAGRDSTRSAEHRSRHNARRSQRRRPAQESPPRHARAAPKPFVTHVLVPYSSRSFRHDALPAACQRNSSICTAPHSGGTVNWQRSGVQSCFPRIGSVRTQGAAPALGLLR